MALKDRAVQLLKGFKGDDYTFGIGVLQDVGRYAATYGSSALVLGNDENYADAVNEVVEALKQHGVELAGGRVFPAARPNAPREDVYRIESYILHFKPDCIVAIGGGSAGSRHRLGRLCHYGGRDQRCASHQLFLCRFGQPRQGMWANEPLLHCVLCPGHLKTAEDHG